MIKYNLNRVTVFGEYFLEKDQTECSLAVDLNEDKRDFYVNRTKTPYIDYVGLLNIVSFIPEDRDNHRKSGVRRSFSTMK